MKLSLRECRRCGRMIGVTKSLHLRAHECPHGQPCVLPYDRRRDGARPKRCAPCVAGRQLPLFSETSE